MTDSVKKWYVVRAVSGQENKVKAHIESALTRENLSDRVEQVLIPKEKVIQVRNGKKVSKERPYFPGYIYIEALLTGEVMHVIQDVPGVIGFLSDRKGGEPMPLRHAEVNRILGKVDELMETGEQIAIPFTVGETVKVIDGAFNGFSGTIEKINEEKRKVEVMVRIFGRKTPLELNFMQVEKE
ncbi:transcription termination/antitermination factor NusG [bacterium]|nr:transcription termination/antitermination factor NusG [bacterium]